jgi:hypothetical protein
MDKLPNSLELALALIISSAAVGCAEQPAAPGQAQSTQAQEKCYASGSRLPSTDCGGSSTVSGQSRDDYMHDRSASPMPGPMTR